MSDWIDCGTYWEHQASQGTDEWLNSRIGRITTTASSAMANNSIFKTCEEQARIIVGTDKEIFTSKELKRMNHGTRTEPVARNWLRRYINREIVERGLIIPKWDTAIGASIDGDIVGTGGITEIKCPQVMYYPLELYMEKIKSGWRPPPNYHEHIWSSHYDQMQHAMAVMGKKWCIYVVYCTTDRSVFTQKILFNNDYWDNHYKVIKQNYNKYVKPYLKEGYPIIPLCD